MTKRAIVFEFENGERVYSPEVEIEQDEDGTASIIPIKPLRPI